VIGIYPKDELAKVHNGKSTVIMYTLMHASLLQPTSVHSYDGRISSYKNSEERTGGMAKVVEPLPSKCMP
jgi:hypothetical protein